MRPVRLALLVLLLLPGTAAALPAGSLVGAGGLTLPTGAVAGGPAGSWEGSDDRRTVVDVSDDGRYVAFVARTDGLAADTPPDALVVYRHDRQAKTTTLVSRATGAAGAPATLDATDVSISDTGRYVAFVTQSRLVPADVDALDDVYVRDTQADVTTLASTNAADVTRADLSGDGALVAFAATSAGVGGQVYRATRAGTGTAIVSERGGVPGNADSATPSIDDDGDCIAFASEATNLVAGFTDANGTAGDVFVRCIAGNPAIALVSGTNGSPVTTNGDNGSAFAPHIAGNPDGGAAWAVVYTSTSGDITSEDTETGLDAYLRRSTDAQSRLLSASATPVTDNLPDRSEGVAIDDTGTAGLFTNDANGSVGNTSGNPRLYARFIAEPGPIDLISRGQTAVDQAALAGTSFKSAWLSQSSNEAGGDAQLPGIIAHDGTASTLGSFELLSRPPGTGAARKAVAQVDDERTLDVSADGRYVLFAAASGLLPDGDDARVRLYRRDVRTGAIDLVSRADGATGTPVSVTVSSFAATPRASLSADGTVAAFTTAATVDPADANGQPDVHVRDLTAGTTRLASRATGAAGAPGDQGGADPDLSADGRFVVFESASTNLGGGAPGQHVYHRDLATGQTTLVDRADGPAGAAGNGAADDPVVSGDGTVVAFTSKATNLDPADGSTLVSVLARDVPAGTTRLLSRRSGAAGANATFGAGSPAISADGRHVAFTTPDQALATEAGPWPGLSTQIVVRDRTTADNRLASRAPDGSPGGGDQPALSADGRTIAFRGGSAYAAGRDGRPLAVVRDLVAGTDVAGPDFGSSAGDTQFGTYGLALSDDGRCVALAARGHAGAVGADWLAPYLWAPGEGCLADPAAPGGGDPGTGTGATPPPAIPPVVGPRPLGKPVLTAASLTNRTFRVGGKRTAVTARAKTGTTFRVTLAADATLAVRIDRRTTGRRRGKRCVAPSRRLRKAKRCTRYVRAGTLTRRDLRAGRVAVAFSGRLGRKALRPGRYRATLVATNAAGRATTRPLAFRVVRR